MSGLFSTFNIVKRAMQSQQTALHVTSHNVANANTEGYSVQRAQLKTTQPFGMPSLTSASEPGQLGTGVEVAAITRARDEFVDIQIRREKGTLGKYNSREEFLSEIETIFMEPSDTGLSTNMSKFWDSWQQLSTTPESSTARTMVVQNAESLANAINHNYDQLEKMQTNAGEVIKEQVFDVNSTLKQIQELNAQIKAVVISGQEPNDLLDRRDLLLDKLSERINFDVEKTDFNGIKINAKLDGTSETKELLSDGTVNIGVSYIKEIYQDGSDWKAKLYVGGEINDEKVVTIPSEDIGKYAELNDDGTVKFDVNRKVTDFKVHTVFYDGKAETLDGTDNGPADFENGSLKGYETVSDEINKFKSQLNNLARVVAISVNTVHSDNGAADGIDFFNSETESADEPAKIIAVTKEISQDPSKINAGRIIGGNAGNGERALLIGQLRNTRLDILSIGDRNDFIEDSKLDLSNLKVTSSSSGATLDSYFKDSIANLGVSNQEAQRMVTNQGALLTQLETRRDSLSGVSLDEEMANMLQFQRAYEANAKMINVLDQLIDVVVNGLIRR